MKQSSGLNTYNSFLAATSLCCAKHEKMQGNVKQLREIFF